MRSVVALLVTGNDAEGTGDDAIAAAIADILLHVNGIKLGTNNGASWTGFLARGIGAMFADIALHEPAISIKEGQCGTGRRLRDRAIGPCFRNIVFEQG